MKGAFATYGPDDIATLQDNVENDNASTAPTSSERRLSVSSTTSAWLPQKPGNRYRINNTTAFPPKDGLHRILGNLLGRKKPKVGLSPDCSVAFFNSEERVVVFSLSERDNCGQNERGNDPRYEWKGRAVAVAIGNKYIAMITLKNELLVEDYRNGERGARWHLQLEKTTVGSIPRLAICETERKVMAAAAIAVPNQAGHGSIQQQPLQEKKKKGAIVIYYFPASSNSSDPALPDRESLDVAPSFVSFDPSGQWLVCITKVSTVHTVRIWSLTEGVQLRCSQQRTISDEEGVSGLTSSTIFSFPPAPNAIIPTTRTYALTTSGRSSTRGHPDESTFSFRIPEDAQQYRQINQDQSSGSSQTPSSPQNNPSLETHNFEIPTHISISSAAISPQANVVAFLSSKAKVYLLPIIESHGSLVEGGTGKIHKFKTELCGEVAMGFTSQGDKLLVVDPDGFVWWLGFTIDKHGDVTEYPLIGGQLVELATISPLPELPGD